MQAQSNASLEEHPFELSAWALLVFIGCVRILKDILQDLFRADDLGSNLPIDIPILAIFVVLLFFLVKRKIKSVPVWVGIILLLLTVWSFIRLGGVEGTSEYNFMALMVTFTLCYRGRNLVIILTLSFTAIVLVNVDQLQGGRITTLLVNQISHSHDSFYTSIIVITVGLLYFKELLKVETSKLRYLRSLIREQRSRIRHQHAELLQQQIILFEANRRLDHDVQVYDDAIKGHNEAINDYIFLSTQNLRLSMTRMRAIPNALRDPEYLATRLHEQINELNLVIGNLVIELDKPAHDRIE